MKITGCSDVLLSAGTHDFVVRPLFSFVFAQWLQYLTSIGVLSKDESYRLTVETWDFESDQDISWTAGEDYVRFRVAMANALKQNSIRGMRVQADLEKDASLEISVLLSELGECKVSVQVNEGHELPFSEIEELLNAAEDEVTKERNNSF